MTERTNVPKRHCFVIIKRFPSRVYVDCFRSDGKLAQVFKAKGLLPTKKSANPLYPISVHLLIFSMFDFNISDKSTVQRPISRFGPRLQSPALSRIGAGCRLKPCRCSILSSLLSCWTDPAGPRPRLSKRGALPSCSDSRQMLDTQTCLVGCWSLQLLEARSSRRAPNVLVVLSGCRGWRSNGWRL